MRVTCVTDTILALIVFASPGLAHAEPTAARLAGLRPDQCGTYLAKGFLRANPWRVVLWEKSQRETALPAEGCRKTAEYLRDLPVNAEFGRQTSGGALVCRKLRAAVSDQSFWNDEALRLISADKCLP